MRKMFIIFIGCLLSLAFATVNAAAPPKTWTFLIFLNGDNNLDSYGTDNIKSMEQVGSNDQVNIVVQWASASAGKAVRLLIQKSNDSNNVTSPVIQDLGAVDMGDYRNLEDFIQWGVQNYPAEHYFVDVWNHGSGWHASKFGKDKHSSHLFGDISYDESTGHSIKTEELGQAMAFAAKVMGHKVDLYGSDACLMAMAEVANEMSSSVDIFAGSQETEPGAGWPYADLLSRWEATPNASAADVAKILTDVYVKSYQGGSNGHSQVTFSAFDLANLPAFNHAMTDFSANVRNLNPTEKAKVISIAAKVQNFAYADYADLLDFTKKLSAAKLSGIQVDTVSRLEAAARQLIIANSVTPRYARATGLSIWLPTDHWAFDRNTARYQKMQFNQETQWGDALITLLNNVN